MEFVACFLPQSFWFDSRAVFVRHVDKVIR